MKGIRLGYDQLDNGEKIFIKFPLNFYGQFISKITKQYIPEEKSVLKFYRLSSSSGNKYAFKFNNFFYFKLHQEQYTKRKYYNSIEHTNNDEEKNEQDIKNDKIYRFNFELAKKSKIINSLNFEMSPLIKITMNNFLKIKYGNYFGSNNQPILFNNFLSNNNIINNKTQYDFSSVFPSMIPYKRVGLSFNKTFSSE